jgi:hypothetical protein
MATSIPLEPLAEEALKQLQSRLESEEGQDVSGRKIVSALIYGATPAQTAGMINAFNRARARARTESETKEADA